MPILPYKLFFLNKVAFLRTEYLYAAIIFFSFVGLILVISMLVIKLHKKSIRRKKIVIAGKLEEWIMDIILENNNVAYHKFPLPAKIELLLRSNFAKKVLLSSLMKVKKSLSGVSGENVERIYNQLKLQKISLKRIAAKRWHIKAKGIQELAAMKQIAHIEKILELTNHKDNKVRMEAQTAMVRLQGYKGLYFFKTLSYPLSGWHQLNLLQLLAHQPITGDNGIINWLNSSNDSVVEFSLKLISEQHAIEFHDDVVKCLIHPNEMVRKEAILCLGQIPSNAAATELNSQFAGEPDKNNRLCIIKEFMQTGSYQDLPFLKPLQYDKDVDIKLAANKTVLYLQKVYNS